MAINVLIACMSISGLGSGPLAVWIKSGQVDLPDLGRLGTGNLEGTHEN